MLFEKGKLDCDPIEVGYDKSREEVLLRHFEKMMERDEIQCASYCVARKGKIILHGAVGPRSFEEGCTEPLHVDTVHPIYSITKCITGVAIMKLVEDGLARLDTLVGEILPQFAKPPYDKITLFHLLTHTSGMKADEGVFEDAYFIGPWEFIEEANKHAKKGEEVDWIAQGLRAGMTKLPGKEWQYCTFGFVILGAVIEKLSGQFANDYIEEHILKPLGMKDSGFTISKDMASRMIYRDEKKKQQMQEIEEGKRSGYDDEGTMWENVPDTGGGLYSTPYDLVWFGNMMLGNGRLGDVRILGRKTVEKMTAYSLHNTPDHCWGANEPNRQYGVGFDMRKGVGFHYSEGTYMHEGYGACSLIIDPVEEMVAAWFVPFQNDQWYAHGLYNVGNIIWSGLI